MNYEESQREIERLKEVNKWLIRALEVIAQLNTSPVMRTKEITADMAIYGLEKAGIEFQSNW